MEELKALAASLTASVDHLRDSVDALGRRTDRQERAVRLTVLGLLLDIVLSIVVGIIVSREVSTNRQLEGAVHQQDVVRNQVLCPLYALILGSYNPQTRAAGPDRDAYNSAFAIMRNSYRVLECTSPIVPPAHITQPPK